MATTKPIHTIYREVTVNENKLSNVFLHNVTYDQQRAIQESLTGGRTSLPRVESSKELQLLAEIVRKLSRVSQMGVFAGQSARSQNDAAAKIKEVPENEQNSQKPQEPEPPKFRKT